MSRSAALKRLLADVRADLLDYGQLETALERQFAAACARDAQGLAEAGGVVLGLVERLDERRRARRGLCATVLGKDAGVSVDAVLGLLPPAPRMALAEPWQALRERVARCKALNERNGGLLAAQQESIERVLHGEKDVYVPC